MPCIQGLGFCYMPLAGGQKPKRLAQAGSPQPQVPLEVMGKKGSSAPSALVCCLWLAKHSKEQKSLKNLKKRQCHYVVFLFTVANASIHNNLFPLISSIKKINVPLLFIISKTSLMTVKTLSMMQYFTTITNYYRNSAIN